MNNYDEIKDVLYMIRDDISFDEDGLLIDDEFDSFEILQIIMLLNERFDIEIPPSEIKPDVFIGIKQISDLVDRLKNIR